MAKPPTNPTGYAIAPDLGPLFAPPQDGHEKAQEAQKAGPSFVSSVPSCGQSSLPSSVEVSARAAEGRRQKILRYLELNGPTTIHEFCAAQATPTLPNQVSGRFTDMAGELLLCVTGQKPHPISGAACNIYEMTIAGRAYLAALKTGRKK